MIIYFSIIIIIIFACSIFSESSVLVFDLMMQLNILLPFPLALFLIPSLIALIYFYIYFLRWPGKYKVGLGLW